ncbi:hypothetical protein D3C87_524030 [compost metagenome]
MATVSAKVYEHHKKSDGTYNVKICVYHKGERKFLDTNHYVVQKQLTKDKKIKDTFVLDKLNDQLREYRKAISELDGRLEYFTAEALKDYLKDMDEDVEFISFCREHIERLKADGRNGTAKNHTAICNSLVDYFKRHTVSIKEINSNMLFMYERFLQSDRTMTRINQFGNSVVTSEKGLSDSGLHNHMRDLRTLFNEARRKYNNEDLGIYRIKHYPFSKYKVGSPPLTKNRNNEIDDILKLRDWPTPLVLITIMGNWSARPTSDCLERNSSRRWAGRRRLEFCRYCNKQSKNISFFCMDQTYKFQKWYRVFRLWNGNNLSR